MANELVEEEDSLAKKDDDRWQRKNILSGGQLESEKGLGKGKYERSAFKGAPSSSSAAGNADGEVSSSINFQGGGFAAAAADDDAAM
eukprot:5068374-Alexandrium_andersonii.AAC.1